ncbi:XrtA system polysaccharide chain length determinant [Janthinobacterium agaricidamnosum]|uniref:Polysaccharide chain length determinant, PEP-CTERM locus subfamily protein n=1 Tax=Janthinobacterium agaricidamnosum NBRC 102515 = DSM 9628 TaxID=1349767 RepID=W0V6M1_9BURK|nr:XrtA system polysaccharide chain length determinant [Janthinobacterium agaricidamnosum]CDG83265.1 polysaccharide chain length determinant, PEP-CTERM locus subfamily protein [Janthinobacterium agaricidamnosum NBRC 102515 = DSM 9628]
MEELIEQLLSSLKGIWKYRWHAVLVAWLVAIAGWSKVISMPDDYQTSARVFVDTQSILKPLLAGMTSVPNVEQQVSIMSRTLLSRPNVERVMRMVDLDLDARTARDHEQQLDELLSKIKIGGTNSYDIYTITYNNKNPKLVRDVVQSLLTIFVEGSFKGKKGDSDKAVQFIDEQIKNYEDKLNAAENLVKEFKIKNNLLLPRQGIDYGSQLWMSSDSLNNARLELVEAEQARNAINSQIAGDEPVLDLDTAPAAIDNPEIDGRISALNKNLDALRMQYTELHPDIISTKRLVAQLEQRKIEESKLKTANNDPGKNYSPMLQQLKVALAEADAKVASIKARVQEYAARYERLTAQSNAVPEVESQLSQLNRDYQINKENYEKLIGRREAAKLSGDLSSTTEMMTFKIIDPPTVPFTPVGPNRPLLLSAVLAGAVLAGAAAALLISQIRPTFLSPSELREVTGMAVLGTVAMNWTAAQRIKRRHSLYGFGLCLGGLFVIYGGVLTVALVRI